MADDKGGAYSAPERFELGASYDEVGPDLGRLYDAWQVDTGQPALEFHPSDRVEWRPSGDYELRVSCQQSPTVMRLRVDASPAPLSAEDLAILFMWTSAFTQRVEQSPRVGLQLTPTPGRPPSGAWHRLGAWLALALGTLLLCLHLVPGAAGAPFARPGPPDAPALTDTAGAEPDGVAYPLPAQPFRNQAAAPCKPDRDEIEINGGCWVTLDRRPPCNKVQAEHQGRCYLPVSKDRGRPPTSVEP